MVYNFGDLSLDNYHVVLLPERHQALLKKYQQCRAFLGVLHNALPTDPSCSQREAYEFCERFERENEEVVEWMMEWGLLV